MWDLTLRLEHIAGSGSKELQSSAIAKSWVAQLSGDTGFRNHSITVFWRLMKSGTVGTTHRKPWPKFLQLIMSSNHSESHVSGHVSAKIHELC